MGVIGWRIDRYRTIVWRAVACFSLVTAAWWIFQLHCSENKIASPVALPAAAVLSAEKQSINTNHIPSATSAARSLLGQIRRHEVDFISLLNEIRQQCLPEWTRTQCNERTRDFLHERFRADNDLNELLFSYDQYMRYEDYVIEHRAVQNLDVEATYRTLQNLRNQFIDPDTRRWMFGAEDARMEYEFALQDFMGGRAHKLSPAERLRELDELRRQSLGKYHDLFAEREDPLLYAETRLHLLQLSDLVTPEEQALKAGLEAEILQLRHQRQPE